MKKRKLFTKIMLLICIVLTTSALKAIEKSDALPNQKNNTGIQTASNAVKSTSVTKALTFKEKVKIIRELKKEAKKNIKSTKGGTPKIILYILAIILPPVAVGIFTNWGQPTLWNLLFTILFWIPGVVHAFYILLR